MQPPQMNYRRIKLPRTDMFFFACWFDENESLDVFAHFADKELALKLSQMLESIAYDPSVHNQDWILPADATVSDYYEVLLVFLAQDTDVVALWASGEEVSEESAARLFQSIEELSQ